MSIKADVHKLLSDAHAEVLKLEDVARDEYLRIEQHVLAAIAALGDVDLPTVEPAEPEPEPKPAKAKAAAETDGP
jgi:hypothetical protein